MHYKSIFSTKITPGKVMSLTRATASMPLATSSGVAKGELTAPKTVPAPGTHLQFDFTLGGCVCASILNIPAYCVPSPAPATPEALMQDIAKFFSWLPDLAQYFVFTATTNKIIYTSQFPGMEVGAIAVPGGFTHTQSNNGLIACGEIKGGRAVVQNPCRVPGAKNPYRVALPASADPGDHFLGVALAEGSCGCECGHGCGCKCFRYAYGGVIGIELDAPPPACPLAGPIALGYSQVDGRFRLYAGPIPAGYSATNVAVTVKLVQGLSALVTFH
jgi:hypothetical protein